MTEECPSSKLDYFQTWWRMGAHQNARQNI